MAQISLMGKPINTNGDLPAVGQAAPAFSLTQTNLKDVTLDACLAKDGVDYLLLSVVPSLDTEVCAASTQQFEAMATDYPSVQFRVVSADLPFAQQRFCTEHGIKQVSCLSGMRDKNFAKDYGLLIQDGAMAGLMARAVVIIKDGQVVYSELVSEITQQPDYEAIRAVLS